MRTPRERRQNGATAVEFAILFPVFMTLALGIMSFGFAFNTWISVTQAAREASRFAATYPVPDVGGTDAWLDQVTAVAKEAAGIGASTPTSEYYVCVRLVNRVGPALTPATTSKASGALPGATCPVPSSSSLPDNAAEVTIVRQANVNWLFGSADVALSADNASRYEPKLGS